MFTKTLLSGSWRAASRVLLSLALSSRHVLLGCHCVEALWHPTGDWHRCRSHGLPLVSMQEVPLPLNVGGECTTSAGNPVHVDGTQEVLCGGG